MIVDTTRTLILRPIACQEAVLNFMFILNIVSLLKLNFRFIEQINIYPVLITKNLMADCGLTLLPHPPPLPPLFA